MILFHDLALRIMVLFTIFVLCIATILGQLMAVKQRRSGEVSDVVQNLNSRVNAWWVMVIIFTLALLTGGIGSIILFFLVSIMALREFLTLTPSIPADHNALIWIYFFLTPLQYILVAVQWYGFFAILIPVYGMLLIPILMVLSGRTEGFLGRAGTIQFAMLICVYSISYVPAIIDLNFTNFVGKGVNLLLYLVVIVQASDVSQYITGKIFGKHYIAPKVSPHKTVEGFLGGMFVSAALGLALFWITPYTPLLSLGMGLLIGILGFCGGLVMSAVKRDKGKRFWKTNTGPWRCPR